MRQNITPQQLRLALFLTALAMAVLAALAAYMYQFQDRTTTLLAMAFCIIYAIARGIAGEDRRNDLTAWRAFRNTPMNFTDQNIRLERAVFARMACDAMWLAINMTICLTWSVAGVMAILFQGLFYCGFTMAQNVRPDLYQDREQGQAVDMLEASLYAVACAAIMIWAWFHK